MNRLFGRIVIIFVLFSFNLSLSAQEIFCNVQVNSQKIQGTDKSVFENMQTALVEFINNRRWTGYDFKVEERIECSIVININERPSMDVFIATLNIVASRPVYKSAYTTPLINYIDADFDFEYVEFQPLEFQENQDMSNLTSVIAYYMYIILGLDFDTFSQYGGSPFFEKAESVVNAAQNSSFPGWKSFEDQKNRYWLVENYLNSSYADLRRFLYNYHMNGLDVMSEDANKGRMNIGESLNNLKAVYDESAGLFALQLILDAKRDEIVNVFSEGNPKERTDAQIIMKEIDPANSSKYSKMTQ